MRTKLCLPLAALLLLAVPATGQEKSFWNANIPLLSYRIPPAPAGYRPEFLDLNGDGKQDAVKTVTRDDIPVLWLDDDGNMKEGTRKGTSSTTASWWTATKTGSMTS